MRQKTGAGKSARARRGKGKPPQRQAKRLIARIWYGETEARRAEEYTAYLHAAGVRKIAAIAGNRGVQMLRRLRGAVAEFEVLSYWDSVDDIKRYAGEDYEKVRALPKDAEYMIGKGPEVRHFEVVVNDLARS